MRGTNRQVLFEVGDRVAYRAGRRGVLVGTVGKLNPKRAMVTSGAAVWDVPYEELEHVSPDVWDKRYGRGLRLFEVAEEARKLMDRYGLRGWSLDFNNSRRQLGACEWATKRILLSREHAVQKSPELVTDIILHEIAHALAGPGAGHGPAWKTMAVRLGARPRSCAPEPAEMRKKRLANKSDILVGDLVTFMGKNRLRKGVVLRKNPKTARVKCPGSIWMVPYARLSVMQEDGSDRKGV